MASRDTGWSHVAASLESLATKFLPLLVLAGVFLVIVLAVREMRASLPAAPPAPATALLLVPDAAAGVQQTVYGADQLFDFNSAALSSPGRNLLQELGRKIKAGGGLQVIVIGHADRLGDAPANQRLSERRASSAGAALVAGGLDATIVTTVGLGSRLPLTRPGECTGASADPKTVACLAKDRRVEVWTRSAAAGAAPAASSASAP